MIPPPSLMATAKEWESIISEILWIHTFAGKTIIITYDKSSFFSSEVIDKSNT